MPSHLTIFPRCSQAKIKNVRFLCIVGSSGAGKSEAVAFLKTLNNNRLEFPVRYTTRRPRLDDDPTENVSVAEDVFCQMLKDGQIFITWLKELPNVGEFNYGISKPDLDDSICVVSGNNSFAKEVKLARSLVVEIWADEQMRRRRLEARAGKLAPKELEARLKALDSLDPTEVDIRIVNTGSKDDLGESLKELAGLIS